MLGVVATHDEAKAVVDKDEGGALEVAVNAFTDLMAPTVAFIIDENFVAGKPEEKQTLNGVLQKVKSALSLDIFFCECLSFVWPYSAVYRDVECLDELQMTEKSVRERYKGMLYVAPCLQCALNCV